MADLLRYPIGRFDSNQPLSLDKRNHWISEIKNTPTALSTAIQDLTSEQLDTPYRPSGWTVRQVVHHLPDSQRMNWEIG